MTLGLLYWILMLFWLIFGFWSGYTPGQPFTFRSWGGTLLEFILFLIVGWKIFGSPIQ